MRIQYGIELDKNHGNDSSKSYKLNEKVPKVRHLNYISFHYIFRYNLPIVLHFRHARAHVSWRRESCLEASAYIYCQAICTLRENGKIAYTYITISVRQHITAKRMLSIQETRKRSVKSGVKGRTSDSSANTSNKSHLS